MFLYDDQLSVVFLRLYVCRNYGLCVFPSFVFCCAQGLARLGNGSDHVNLDTRMNRFTLSSPSVVKVLGTGTQPRYDIGRVHGTSRKQFLRLLQLGERRSSLTLLMALIVNLL